MSYVRTNFCCFYYYYHYYYYNYYYYCYFKWFDLNFLFIVGEETLISLKNPGLNVLWWKNTDTLLSISSQTVLLLKYLTSCHVIPSCTYSSYEIFQWKLVTLKKGRVSWCCWNHYWLAIYHYWLAIDHFWLAIVCGVSIVRCPFNVLYYVIRWFLVLLKSLLISHWPLLISLCLWCGYC